MRIPAALLVAFAWTAAAPGQDAAAAKPIGDPDRTAPAPSLILVENLWDERDGVCHTRQLVRYRIRADRISPKEVLISREQRFFGHFGGHAIAGDRYVVTRYGSVIDLATNEIVHEEILGELITCNATEVVYRIDNVNVESGVFVLDLESRNLTKAPEGDIRTLPGLAAPDASRTAEMTPDGELWLHSAGSGARRRLAEGFGFLLSPLSSAGGAGPPFHWLDNATILTQNDNGRLVTVDMHGETRDFIDLYDLPAPASIPTLCRDPAGQLLYTCGTTFVIDVGEPSAAATSWRSLGHGFDVQGDTAASQARIVRHRQMEIGRHVSLPWMAATAPGRLAIAYAAPRAMGYPKGLHVWTEPRRTWTTIEISVNSVVGWTENP